MSNKNDARWAAAVWIVGEWELMVGEQGQETGVVSSGVARRGLLLALG